MNRPSLKLTPLRIWTLLTVGVGYLLSGIPSQAQQIEYIKDAIDLLKDKYNITLTDNRAGITVDGEQLSYPKDFPNVIYVDGQGSSQQYGPLIPTAFFGFIDIETQESKLFWVAFDSQNEEDEIDSNDDNAIKYSATVYDPNIIDFCRDIDPNIPNQTLTPRFAAIELPAPEYEVQDSFERLARLGGVDLDSLGQLPTPTPSTGGGGGGGCFIATAAWGTAMAGEVKLLCNFRDDYLLTTPEGKALVNMYYTLSPPIADFIRDNELLKYAVRKGLEPIVQVLSK